MGGFTYFDGETEIVLGFDNFRRLLGIPLWGSAPEPPQISFPTITAAEIHDKARGDFLSKTIVILQSIWFIVQCAARGKQGLALTELEIVTVALASLNGVMYYFWWDKPLGVKEPVKLHRRGHEPAEIKVTQSNHNVRRAMFSNVLRAYQMLSRNDTRGFVMLQDRASFRGWSSVPLESCTSHSLNFLISPVQFCFPVTINSPRSITTCPPSHYQPSTHSSTKSVMSWISRVAATFGIFTFPLSGFS